MPLSNSQYNAIMRMYEEKQRRSRYLLEQRKDAVYQQIPEYEELDHQVSSTSIAQARKMLSGDSNALSELKEKLAWLSRQRPASLQLMVIPPIIWSQSMNVLYVRTPAM